MSVAIKMNEDILFEKVKEYLCLYDNASIQKQSFDFFIHHRLNKIIEEEPTLEVPLGDNKIYCVKFGQVFVDKPYIIDDNRQVRYITPNEARIRDLTYSSAISVNIRTCIVENNVETSTKNYFKVLIARIPLMIGTSKCNLYNLTASQKEQAGECHYDSGGYFIVKGKERVLVSQERMNYNIVYVFEQKPTSKYLLVAEIRSMSEETGHSVLVQMKITNNKKIVMQLPYVTQDIPLGIVMKAFQLSQKQIEDILLLSIDNKTQEGLIFQRIFRTVIRDAEIIDTHDKALSYISQFAVHNVSKERKFFYVNQIIYNELFPHLGITSDRAQKGYFIGHMFSKLLYTFLEKRPMDDRDHIANKRIEVSGHLLSELFRTLFKRFVRTIEPQLAKRPDIMVVISRVNVITQGIKHCFSTGNWGIPKSSYIRTGVSQVLSRLTYNSFLSHLRRIIVPVGKEGKNTKIRQVHPSQIGFICAHETPEGHSAGIVKNMAMSVQVTTRIDMIFIRMILEENPLLRPLGDLATLSSFDNVFKVFVNGNWLGICIGLELFHAVKLYKHQNRLPYFVSVSVNMTEKEIHIYGDEGRFIRPLWDVRRLPTEKELRKKSMKCLIEERKILFLDQHEIENYVIAMTHKETLGNDWYDLIELHPSLLTGLCVALIPYVEHTQAPRVTYHASMGKQAIGYYATSHAHRVDTISHVMCYPERPLIKTHYGELMGCDDLATGNNLIVAICMYTGFNQEDSVIFNQSAIDRGLFRSFSYKTIIVEERKKSTSHMETIEFPSEHILNKSFNYSKLNPNGIIKVGVFVGCGDVIVARVQTKIIKSSGEEKIDTSVIIKSGEEGYVDKVYITFNPDGYKLIKVKLRTLRVPEIGDKVASRSAQKGTIGMTYRHEDMPFSESGIVPDIIINPLCIPSRMTINQLIECLGAKSAAYKARQRYSTAFSSHSTDVVEYLSTELSEIGFERHGNEVLHNGFSGERFHTLIFMGPTYYHRLKHLVSAKIHARNHGSLQALTRQPLEGRSRDGGLRFGEMERDAMISHGVSRFLTERLFDMSDKFSVPVCSQCGVIPNSLKQCNNCEGVQLRRVPLPYACKLLFQELNAMGIKINLFPVEEKLAIVKHR